MTVNTTHPDHRAEEMMSSVIGRVATGPELSKDLTRDEARTAMQAVLDGAVDPVQSAVFLIALRMKRETDAEACGVLDALREATRRVEAPVDEVLGIADPYNGYNRSLPAAPLLAPVLAACGVATVAEGVRSVGPKYGITHHLVLDALGVPVDEEPAAVAGRLGDAAVGWGYVDQRRFCPALNDLVELRRLMVKRPVLTTTEVLLGPITGARRTHLMTGYVHKPYPRVYGLLARHAGFDSALLVRGVEGGVIPSLRQAGRCFRAVGADEEVPTDLDPRALGIESDVRAPHLAEQASRDGPGVGALEGAKAAAEAGLGALRGEAGPTRDALVYGAALALWHLGRSPDLEHAARCAREALDSGAALARLDAARRR